MRPFFITEIECPTNGSTGQREKDPAEPVCLITLNKPQKITECSVVGTITQPRHFSVEHCTNYGTLLTWNSEILFLW